MPRSPVSNSISIRTATPEDLEQLEKLYSDLIPNDVPAPEHIREQHCRSVLAHPGLSILVAEKEGELVSTCTLIVIPNLTRGGAPYALIENVVTRQDYRGCGYGEAVVLTACDKGWEAGCYKIMLLSGNQNQKAHKFYERIGFQKNKTGFQMRASGYAPRTVT